MQTDLDRLEKWAEKNLMEFNKGKNKVLQLGRNNNNPMHQYMLGLAGWQALGREGPGVLVYDKLNTTQQRGKGGHQPPGLHQAERCQGVEGRGVHGEIPAKAHKDDEGTGASLISGEAERAGTAEPGEEKAQGDLINT
ncbi:mitochondrial enolase superfamily member 1 [Grus japonensis]|uniref:Mitochondrial enolase superfamily member 1 n=1 Tax=Grus japonensis TaxID=30415 RepID=A0ABC9X0I4_GRUJA